MKNIIITLSLSLALWCVSLSQGWACYFDSDCKTGSKCLKAAGAMYGVCQGGFYPGNENDKEPVNDPYDLDKTYGNTCQSDIECGLGKECLRSKGSIYGVCMKKSVTKVYPAKQEKITQEDKSGSRNKRTKEKGKTGKEEQTD